MMSGYAVNTYRTRSARARRARAQYVYKCRIITGALIAAVIIGIVFSVVVLRSRASGTDAITDYKYYKNIVIAYDYDLHNAAADYADEHYDNESDYLREVCFINHLASASDVTPGTHVIVPYYEESFH